MMLTEEKLIRLRNHDWRNTILDGTRAAEQNVKEGVLVDHTHIVWELLREAASVSRLAKFTSQQYSPSTIFFSKK